MTLTDCTPRETLKRYLAGWIDVEESSRIEQHLAECTACEQTVVELEERPDTLLVPLRARGPNPDDAFSIDSRIEHAVSKARRLMDQQPPAPLGGGTTAPKRIGVYEIIEPLGRGGMATVYLARHRSLDKLVAIKLRPAIWQESQEAAARFEREIRASGKLNHPAIVSATDAGEEGGIQFLVMEYISGMDLSRVARHVRGLRIADACEIARQAALGLSHAHIEGIVHRDVKPSNLMLDDKGAIKILDFGLAQVDIWDETTAELTSVGQLMGTLDYMAPEQAERSGAVDYRADLYSLGATLFRLLCGRPPHLAAPNISPLEKLRLLAERVPPRLETLRSDAPRELGELVAQLLSRYPDARPASAAHVAERLAGLATGADLAALLAEAKKSEATKASLRSEYGSTSHRPATSQQAGGRATGRRKWWIVSALAPLAILAGVVITLEMQKGQLVIDSEVADVSVKLLQDGETIDTLRLEVGATSTRLAAGSYEVLIDSPSDSIVVDKNQLLIKRGGTTVARVTEKAATEVPLLSDAMQSMSRLLVHERDEYSSLAQSATARQPVYEGRTLEDWIDQLARDRSPKAMGDALYAIKAMLTPENGEQIREALVNILPTIDGTTKLSNNNINTDVDTLAFEIFAKSSKGRSYYEWLASELARAEPEWGRRLLVGGGLIQASASDEEIEPLVNWLGSEVLRPEANSKRATALVEPASDWLWSKMLGRPNSELADRILQLLASSPHVEASFWLRQPPRSAWQSELIVAVLAKAQEALRTNQSDAQTVTMAAMVLYSHLVAPVVGGAVNVDELAQVVQVHLRRLGNDRSRALSVVDIDSSEFGQFIYPAFSFTVPPEHRAGRPTEGKVFYFQGPPHSTNETQELLDLAFELKRKSAKTFDTAELMNLTAADYKELSELIPPGSLSITWPSVNAVQSMRGGGPRMMDRHPPTHQWLAYFIHIQAADLSDKPVPLFAPAPER